jgi:hypothetical protein
MTDRVPICDPLLTSLVDDAGLFPPTELPMAEALARHEADSRGRHPMLSHRFLVRASRIGELRETAPAKASVQLGVIFDTDPGTWGAALTEVRNDPRLAAAMVDVPVPAGEDAVAYAASAADRLDREAPGVPVFFEPPRPEWVEVPGGAVTVRGLKVRCGGARADVFPSPGELAAFIAACARKATPFKATAGLHEAVRHTDTSTGFTHHGFLNLLVATARAAAGADRAEVEAALMLTEADPLVAEVRDLPGEAATAARRLLLSYGSCSTSEPIEAAARLGLVTSGP